MPELTRRPDPHRSDCWLIYFGDVHVGTVARAVGTPNATEEWRWQCGFYPGCNAGEHRAGSAPSFDQARSDFERAWRTFSARRTEADYQAWRDQRDWDNAEVRHAGPQRAGPAAAMNTLPPVRILNLCEVLTRACKLYLKLVRRSQARRGNPLLVPRRLHLSAAPQVSGPKGSNDHDHRYHSGCPQQT